MGQSLQPALQPERAHAAAGERGRAGCGAARVDPVRTGQLCRHRRGPGARQSRRLRHPGARRGRQRADPLEPAAGSGQRCTAGAFLGRHARAIERDARHQYGARVLRVRPRQGLPRRDGPPGQRLPDHRRVLARAERAFGRVRQARALRVHSGLRVVGQHGGGRRPQRALPARGRDHPSLLARADRGRGRHRRRAHRRARCARAVSRSLPARTAW